MTIEAALLDGDEEQSAGFDRVVEVVHLAAPRAEPSPPRLADDSVPPPEPYVAYPGRTAEAWAPELELPNLCALGIRAAQAGRLVSVRVRDWTGAPVRGSTVDVFEGDAVGANYIVSPSWHVRTAVTDAAGEASFWVGNGWDNHELTANPPGNREDVGPQFTGPYWRPEDCTVTLPHTFVVRGTVRDSQGKPTPARVESRDQNRVQGQWEYTALDGTFAIRMAYGPLELVARSSDAPTEDWPASGGAAVSPEHPVADLEIQPPKPDPPPK
jgi:hypothetical protein